MRKPYKTRLGSRERYCSTLGKLFAFSTNKYRKRRVSQYADGSGGYTYGEFRDKCELLSIRMSRFGISTGDKVAILSQNMPNWTIAFFFPIHPRRKSRISSPTRRAR